MREAYEGEQVFLLLMIVMILSDKNMNASKSGDFEVYQQLYTAAWRSRGLCTALQKIKVSHRVRRITQIPR